MWVSVWWKTKSESLEGSTRLSPLPHPQRQSQNWPAMFRGRLWVSVQSTTCWRLAAVPHLQNWNTITAPPVFACSSARTACFRPSLRWGCWRRHGCSPPPVPVQSPQVSSKTPSASFVSSRTSVSRANAGPRVCPFCPGVVVPSQALILLSQKNRRKKKGEWPPP